MKPLDGHSECSYCRFKGEQLNNSIQLKPGTVLQERYLVGCSIGQGGFGITYIGRDERLDMRIAIKEYFPSGYANRNSDVSPEITIADERQRELISAGRESFLKEARALAGLIDHKGVVDVRDFFEENGTAYIIMEYLEGDDLRDILKKTVFNADDIFKWMEPVFSALEKMHSKNIIHRDISPDNIKMLKDGSLKLMDFGAARMMNFDSQRSMSVVLKAGYAPEEQYRPKGSQGPWTDVYALCATIYKCITGITPDDSLQRSYEDEIKWPSELGIAISPNQEKALKKGLAVRAKDRVQSIAELRGILSGRESEGAYAANQQSKQKEDARTVYVPRNKAVEEDPDTVYVPRNKAVEEDPDTVYVPRNRAVEEDPDTVYVPRSKAADSSAKAEQKNTKAEQSDKKAKQNVTEGTASASKKDNNSINIDKLKKVNGGINIPDDPAGAKSEINHQNDWSDDKSKINQYSRQAAEERAAERAKAERAAAEKAATAEYFYMINQVRDKAAAEKAVEKRAATEKAAAEKAKAEKKAAEERAAAERLASQKTAVKNNSNNKNASSRKKGPKIFTKIFNGSLIAVLSIISFLGACIAGAYVVKSARARNNQEPVTITASDYRDVIETKTSSGDNTEETAAAAYEYPVELLLGTKRVKNDHFGPDVKFKQVKAGGIDMTVYEIPYEITGDRTEDGRTYMTVTLGDEYDGKNKIVGTFSVNKDVVTVTSMAGNSDYQDIYNKYNDGEHYVDFEDYSFRFVITKMEYYDNYKSMYLIGTNGTSKTECNSIGRDGFEENDIYIYGKANSDEDMICDIRYIYAYRQGDDKRNCLIYDDNGYVSNPDITYYYGLGLLRLGWTYDIKVFNGRVEKVRNRKNFNADIIDTYPYGFVLITEDEKYHCYQQGSLEELKSIDYLTYDSSEDNVETVNPKDIIR